MNILVVSTYFSPDVCGIAPIAADLCAGLAERGHRVTVLTSFPHYPEWKNKSGCWPWSKSTEKQINGVEVIRHGAWIPSRPSSIVPRLLYEGSMLISLFRSLLIRRSQFDAIYAVCPSAGNLLYARVRTFLTGEPVVINVQDIPAEAASAAGLASGFVGRLAAAVQRWLFRAGQTLTTISQPMVECLRRSVSQEARLTPNWLVGEIADAVSAARRDVQTVTPTPLVPDLLYSGNIGNKQGLIEFCSHLQQCDFPFQLTINGCGSAYEALRQQLVRCPDDRIISGPLLDFQPFVDRLKRATWFVITEKSGMGAAVMPSKLIPAVSLGVPILAICDDDGALGKAITDHQIGIRLGWDSLDQLEEKLVQVTDEQRATFRENSGRLAESFDRDASITAIEQILADAQVRNNVASVATT